MGWTAQSAPCDSEIINELLSRVTHSFDGQNSPEGLSYHQRTALTDAAGIRQPKQPLGNQISSKKLLPRVTLGFDSPNSP
jgi:hypothetical protein